MPKVPRPLWSPERQVFVRPTNRGWQAIVFGALSLVAALLVGTTQIYQLAYALAGLLLASLVLGLLLSRGLRYTRRISKGERLMAGCLSRVEFVVSNVSRTSSPGVEIVDHLPERRVFQTPPLRGSEARGVRESVLFAKRGFYEIGPAEIQTIDPFGLLRFVRRFKARTEVVVYPEVFELAGFSPRGRKGETGAQDSFARQGDEFSGLREYRRGDDRRHIHWKSVARTGELIVREFAHSAPWRHAVVLDLYRAGIGLPETEVEDAVSAAGSILSHLARESLPLRLLCTDKERGATAFGADESTYWRAMGLLATARADGDVKPGDFLDEKLREEREELGEGVILISRSLGEGLAESVEKLRAAGLSALVVAVATHTYRTGGATSRREAAFSEDVRRLELAGSDVRVVRHPGGVAAFAGVRSTAKTGGAV